MKILSVINEKGGVGKTTTTLNVAHELTRHGFRTLLLDLDKQCDLTKTVYRQPWDIGIREVLEGTTSIDEIYYENEDKLRFILGSKDICTFYFKKVTNTQENKENSYITIWISLNKKGQFILLKEKTRLISVTKTKTDSFESVFS